MLRKLYAESCKIVGDGWGGKREGAGRKENFIKKKLFEAKVTDDEWNKLKLYLNKLRKKV